MLIASFFYDDGSQAGNQMRPIIEGIDQDLDYIDIDCKMISQHLELAANFGIDYNHLPCLLVMNSSGETLARIAGYHTRDRLLAIIKTLRK